MKTKVVCGLVLSFLVLTIFGCGGGGGATPSVVSVTQSATRANTSNNNTINASVTITAIAEVNGTAVPDGTLVAFTVKSGAGTLSAPSATTVNGTASVTLTSTTDGASVVVTGSYGGLSDDSAAITFTDPNRPAGVTVTANPTTGVVPGTPVAISASITRLGGNGVPAGPVPDGTIVSFAVTSGIGGTLSALSAPTTGGIATVNLTSTIPNANVLVEALAGSVSNTVTVPFIAQPTQAIVKVQTNILPVGQLIANITATVTYPTNKGLSITAGNVFVSGSGIGADLAVNVATLGQVGLSLSGINATIAGIPAGEFATLTFSIAPGNVPTASDFGIAPGANVLDDLGAQLLTALPITIMSVTIR